MTARKGVFWLVIVCAFLAGVCAYPMILWGAYTATSYTPHSRTMYVARTTIMESLGPPMKGQPDYYKMRLDNLVSLATSQAVFSNAAQTLDDLGMKSTVDRALSGTSVTPVQDTNILAIEVTTPDLKEAMIAADVIAAEIKKEYVRQHESDAQPVATLRTLDPAFGYRVTSPRLGASILPILFSPYGGPAIGVIVGLVLGLAIAALARKRQTAT